MIPTGFKVTEHLRRRSQQTGQLSPSPSGLQNMLINVAYLGHRVHKQVITQWHNHEAIIPEELFMFDYNRISQVDFHGQANPHYVAYRPWVRHAKGDRKSGNH